jgi:bifunctional DNase/RNase
MDARVGDAIALALRAEVPVMVTEKLLVRGREEDAG